MLPDRSRSCSHCNSESETSWCGTLQLRKPDCICQGTHTHNSPPPPCSPDLDRLLRIIEEVSTGSCLAEQTCQLLRYCDAASHDPTTRLINDRVLRASSDPVSWASHQSVLRVPSFLFARFRGYRFMFQDEARLCKRGSKREAPMEKWHLGQPLETSTTQAGRTPPMLAPRPKSVVTSRRFGFCESEPVSL